MPRVTIDRSVSLEDAAAALQEQFGGDYTVTPSRSGSKEKIVVRRSLAIANVHLARTGETTTFRVRGGGVIINRIINQFGIARRVTTAIGDAFGSATRT
jgi:hypothetical protein